MKKLLVTTLIVTIILTTAIAENVEVTVYEKVPTVLVEGEKTNLDLRVMYGFIKLYQDNKSFNLGQVIVKIKDDNEIREVKVLVTKDDLEKFINRDVDYSKFIREYAKFI